MEIRKQFKFEMAHIVRNAWSRRCSKNVHGHSYILELFFSGEVPDNAGMLVDFGIVKKYLNDFIDSFDHSFVLWDRKEDEHIKEFFQKEFERVIITPWSTSCEVQAKMFGLVAQHVLDEMFLQGKFINGEEKFHVSKARLHETATGYAEWKSDDSDYFLPSIEEILTRLQISDKIVEEWKEKEFWKNLLQR